MICRAFLIILFIVVIGFASAFSIILEDRGARFNCNESDPIVQEICENKFGGSGAFSSPIDSLRSAFSYMLGGFDFEDLNDGPLPVLLLFIWALFMFIVVIILFNILIAIISER